MGAQTIMSRGRKSINAFDEDTWTEDEVFYFRSVDLLWNERSSAPISNGRPLHAVYLLHKFFEDAQKEVRIFPVR